MDGEIAQLMEMGALRAQAIAALTKYKDVMQAAERFFDGEFENVKDGDSGPPVASGSKIKSTQRAPSPDPASDEDDEMADDDDDEGEYIDYDSDAELGTYHVADVDPYAGIFFSKDRRQEEIEIEEAPEYVSFPNTSDPIQLMSQGEWMKGCPEGSEQSFLFTLYHSLTDGTLSCMNCQQHIALRKKSDFFALHPDFDDYTDHLKLILEKQCPRCSKKSCFACGELYSDKHAGADVLHHCAELQGVIVGVGLYMVERMMAEQNGETSREDDSSGSVPNKRRKTEAPARKKAPGGTGYDGAPQEDNSGQLRALQDQRAKDESLGNLLTSVREHVPDMKRDGGQRASDHMVHPTTLAHLRRRFCPALSNFLRNDSLTDMEERSVFYFELFEWLKTVANHESFASMMAQPVMLPISVPVTTKKGQSTREKKIMYEGSSSPRELLESIVIQATAALKGLNNLSVQVVEEEMTEEEKRITGTNAAAPVEEVPMSDENRRLFDFCQRIIDTAGVIDRFLRDTKGAKFFERMQSALPKITPVAYDEVKVNAGASDQDTQKAYTEWASRARFEYGDLTIHEPGGSEGVPHYKHYFSNEARLVVGSDLPRRSLSIAKELAVLTTNIPVSWGSSVFLRVDESRVDVIKAIITGPEGTPYHNGCYLFDIFLGTDYNRAPPRVKYMTTNGGAYRFNPNLYADGKVCLSLLGTWSGPGWVPGKSTLLQVLISIQAMILCEEPYLNEPGWSESAGTPQSKAYSANVRRMVVHTAMLDALRNPPEPFGDVIRTHFRLKAKSICAQLDEWLKMDDGVDTAGDGAMVANTQGLAGITLGRVKKANSGSGTFARHVQEMKGLLDKLVKGEPLK